MASSIPVDSSASSSECESGLDDDDRELQLALNAGLLRTNGLNVKRVETQRPTINKTVEMDKNLSQIVKKRGWIATLDVTFSPALTYTSAVSNDFEREAAFAKQAQDSALTAVSRLQSLDVPIFRPADYFAEMAKSDEHMRKVRERLIETQKAKERRETGIRLREEKKFAVEVQRASEARKHKEKRNLMVAVKQHRKGMKERLDAILNNKSRDEFDAETDRGGIQELPCGRAHGGRNNKRKISRNARDKKYGYGGPKKGAKKNDKKSFENVSFNAKSRQGRRVTKGRKGRK